MKKAIVGPAMLPECRQAGTNVRAGVQILQMDEGIKAGNRVVSSTKGVGKKTVVTVFPVHQSRFNIAKISLIAPYS